MLPVLNSINQQLLPLEKAGKLFQDKNLTK
jgi:hypothetical protein